MDDPRIPNETKKGCACPHPTLPPWTGDAERSVQPPSFHAVRQALGNTAVLKAGSRDPASPQDPLGDGRGPNGGHAPAETGLASTVLTSALRV